MEAKVHVPPGLYSDNCCEVNGNGTISLIHRLKTGYMSYKCNEKRS